jgi:hypothetical protein
MESGLLFPQGLGKEKMKVTKGMDLARGGE